MKMLLRASSINVIIFVLFGLAKGAYLIDFSHIYRTNAIGNVKREGKSLECISKTNKNNMFIY